MRLGLPLAAIRKQNEEKGAFSRLLGHKDTAKVGESGSSF
jgi:hypothetical protein